VVVIMILDVLVYLGWKSAAIRNPMEA